MKLQKIKAVCKQTKMVYILNDMDEQGGIGAQYISDGNAIYEICDSLTVTEASLCAMWDIPEKEREKWIIREGIKDKKINCEWGIAANKELKEFGITISIGGMEYIPYLISSGLIWLESIYMDPIADELQALEFFERQTEEGKPYIVAQKGMIFVAAFIPVAEQVAAILEEKLWNIAVKVKKPERENK